MPTIHTESPCAFPVTHCYFVCAYGFLGRVVYLAPYKTNVLCSKPPGRLVQTPDWCPYYFCFRVCPFVSHISPHWIRVRAFAHMEWGLLVSPYEIGTLFLLHHGTLAKCTGLRSPIARPNAKHNLVLIVWTALSTRRCNEDLIEQIPRLWNCLQAAAMESQNQDTRELVGNPSRQIPLGVRRGSTTSPRV